MLAGHDQLLQEPVPLDLRGVGQGVIQGPGQPEIPSARHLLSGQYQTSSVRLYSDIYCHDILRYLLPGYYQTSTLSSIFWQIMISNISYQRNLHIRCLSNHFISGIC